MESIPWLPALFGWPAFAFGFCLSIFGLVMVRPVLLFTSAGIICLPSLYLAANPGLLWAISIPLLAVAAGWSLRHRRQRQALAITTVWISMVLGLALYIFVTVEKQEKQQQGRPQNQPQLKRPPDSLITPVLRLKNTWRVANNR
jgi:hypothetical protein